MLLVNGVAESASYIEEPYRNYPPFTYLRQFERILSEREAMTEVLLLGGAGFSFPKYVISKHPGVHMDVVEIDPMMVELAKRYFYLTDLLNEYGEDRLSIIYADANQYMKVAGKKYHAIFHDAYTEDHIDQGLLSESGIRLVKEHLRDGGIYAINFITSLSGFQSMPGILAREQMKQQFKNVRLYGSDDSKKTNTRQNCILVGSDGELTLNGSVE